MSNTNITLTILTGIVISLIMTIINISIIDNLFFEKVNIQRIEKMLKDPMTELPDANHSSAKIKMGHADWTWPSVISYFALQSVFWYIFGYILTKLIGKKTLAAFLPPIIVPLLFGDLAFPFYLLSCFLGARRNKNSYHGERSMCPD